ncbi:MAG TPA: type III polyketide synthase [Actinomycetota bacterium]|nr:type III polyketide synthase [Actinomycetota bacterium]
MVAAVAGIGTAAPIEARQDEAWELFFSEHYGGSRVAERIWRRSGVERRHGVAVPWKEDVTGWGTEARMRRFIEEARPLGTDAVRTALGRAGLLPGDVDLFTVVSCTGYASPGLDVLVARDLGMRPDLHRLHVGHMGCYAGLPGLATLADAASARGAVGVLLCLELSSLHLQPPTEDVDQIVAHALFSDAAAAVAVRPEGPGLEVVDVVARTAPDAADLMTWDLTDHGFRMGLSPRVPATLGPLAGDAVEELLTRHGVAGSAVAGWAIHPGGPRIVEAIAGSLGLSEDQVGPSRSVLRDFGNCSSPTVFLVLERLLEERPPSPGDPVVAVAFGPGLTVAAALLVGSGQSDTA